MPGGNVNIALALSLLAAAAAPVSKDPAADVNAPHPQARAIPFEAREGTWLSLDLSPDGATIVFDLLGDLWALPIAGGEARALTSGPAWDTQPRFSPDGKTIAFTSDRGGVDNLWLVDADGKAPRALTSEKNGYVRAPAWTADGQFLLARKEDGTKAGIPPVELWMFHREGGGGIKLVASEAFNSSAGPVASADGRFVYFAGRRGSFNYIPNLQNGLWQVQRLDRRTGETRAVTEGIGGGGRPALTRDGKTLVYVSRRDAKTVLAARHLDSGFERVLVGDTTRDEQEGFAQLDVFPGYAIAPDDKDVVFFHHGKLARVPLAGGDVREIPFVAKGVQHAAPRVTWQEKVEQGPLTARILRRAQLTPDGGAVVFDALGRVWVQRLANAIPQGAPRRLTPDPSTMPARLPDPGREYLPAVSPDGQWVAYVTWDDREGGAVYKTAIAGGAPVRLTGQPGHFANPSWSPDGKWLAVARGTGLEFRGRQPEDESAFELHVLDANGGEPRLVTAVDPGGPKGFHPVAYWSADGARLYYREGVPPAKPGEPGKNDLVSIRLDGTDKRRHLRLPAVSEVAPSPDGTWVAFASRDNVYVAALPGMQLPEPPEVGIKDGALPVIRLSRDAGSFVAWADGGKTLTWTLGRTFHALPLAEALKFAAFERAKAAKKDDDKAEAGKGGAKKEAAKPAAPEDPVKVPGARTFEIALRAPRATPAGSFVLEGARVITMKGDEVLMAADVLVTGNRIVGVGAPGTLKAPADARRFDARGKTVIPGLIDTHAHFHYSGLEVLPEQKWEYVANLAYGVTTTYDPSAPSIDTFAQAEMVEAGLMTGPRIYSSGDVLYGGQAQDIWAEVENLHDARRQVRRMKAYGARMIKVYQQPRRAQRLWFAEASRLEKMLLTAEGGGEHATDMTMAMDGFTAFEHSLPLPLGEDSAQFLARAGTHYTPTLLVSYGGPWGELYFWQEMNPHDDPKLRRFVPHRLIDVWGRRHPWVAPEEYQFWQVAEGVAKVARAGGNVSLGAHGQVQGLGPHWELWAMAGIGGRGKALTAMEALRASTLQAADKLGFAPDLGSVEAGKLADLVVLDADPLADIRNTAKIRWVVKNGELYEGETLKQLWPTEKPAPKFLWQE
jgi:Tol biopolymer transport system component/imidazolonepropionase-like amidohydrolase